MLPITPDRTDVFRAKLAIYALNDPEGYARNALRLKWLSAVAGLIQGSSMPGFRTGVGGGFVPGVVDSSDGPMITVLGSLRDTKQFIGRPGFNVLNIPDEIFAKMAPEAFDRINAQWLNMSLRRGDAVWLATDPAAYANTLMAKYQTTAGSRYLSLELPILEEYGSLAPTTTANGQSAFMLFTR